MKTSFFRYVNSGFHNLFLAIFIVTIVVFLLLGFSDTAWSAKQQKPITIAVIAGLTGMANIASTQALNAMKMETEKMNALGGVNGRRVKLLIFDDESNPMKTLKIAQKPELASVDGVIGFAWSKHLLVAGPTLQKRKIPVVAVQATHDEATLAGDYIFRVCFKNTDQGKALAKYAHKVQGARRALLFINEDNSYSKHLSKVIAKEFLSQGGKVVKSIRYIPGQSSEAFLEEIKKVNISQYDSVFLTDTRVYVLPILEAFRVLGAKNVAFFGGDGWNMSNMGEHADRFKDFRFYVISHWHPEKTDIRNRVFIVDLKNRSKLLPNDSAALSHDAFHVLIDAIRKSKNRADIVNQLRQTNYVGITGKIQFDANGDPKDKEMIFNQMHTGRRTKGGM